MTKSIRSAVLGLTMLCSLTVGAQKSVTQRGDPILASSTNSPANEAAANTIDGTTAKYLNFDSGRDGTQIGAPPKGFSPSGFVVTPSVGLTRVTGMSIQSANDSDDRDPDVLLIEGSNDASVTSFNSGNWQAITVISNIARGFTARLQTQTFTFENAQAYKRYRLTVQRVRITPNGCCMQVAEVALLGSVVADSVTQPGDRIFASSTNSPPSEGVANAIDNNPATKYLNFDSGRDGKQIVSPTNGFSPSGFVVIPGIGRSLVTRISIQSANDAPERDPDVILLEGSNDSAITSFAGGAWEAITTISDMAARFTARLQIQNFDFGNVKSFDFYRLTVLRTRVTPNGCCMQVAEVTLHGTAAVVPALEPPVITTPPQSQTVAIGNDVTFSVAATGTPPLGYQWRISGKNISGATNASYTVVNAQTNSGGTYDVVVSNKAGSVPSVQAVLTIITNPRDGCLFFAGLDHCPVGGARINNIVLKGQPAVRIDNLGTSGTAGGTIALGGVKDLTIELQPLDLSAAGASLFFKSRGTIDGGPNILLAQNSFVNIGENRLQVTVDSSTVGSALLLVEVFSNRVSVGSTTVPLGVIGNVTAPDAPAGTAQGLIQAKAINPIPGVDVIVKKDLPPYNGIIVHFVKPIEFLGLHGDEIHISPTSLRPPPTILSSVILTAANVPEIVILSETVRAISDATPVLYRAVGSPSLDQVTVVFSEAVGAASTNLANFSIPGLTISKAILANGGTNIVLTTSAQTPNTAYNVTVKDVKDLVAGLVMSPNPTTVKFTSWLMTNGVLQKYWTNIPDNNIAGLTNDARFPNRPTFTTLEPAFEYPANGLNEAGTNYGNQLIAYLKPATTGDYVFFLCSDDPGVLYLSTDENPGNKHLIAQETAWSNARQWTTSGGNSDFSAKRSDKFASSGWPTPNTIHLTAGQLYYMEALHTEGGGGDNVGVAWIKAGAAAAAPADGSPPIPGANLFTQLNPDVVTATIAITSPANNVSLTEGASVTFTVNAADTNGPIRKVEFMANGAKIGESTAPFSFTWASVPAGRYTVTANLLDRQGYVVSSAPITVVVNPSQVPEQICTNECGMMVVTYFSGSTGANSGFCSVLPSDPNGFVMAIVDSRNPTGPTGQNWLAPRCHNASGTPANQWRASNLGEVFGIALDRQTPPNIYVTATSIYPGDQFGPGGPGGVYRIDGSTFNICSYISFADVGSVSLGNICYDRVHDQFFVSDLDHGWIRRVKGAGCAGVEQVPHFDHGITGRANQLLPIVTDSSGSNVLTDVGRRVFGLQCYQNRLYYSVTDSIGGATTNEIWSVGLDVGGDFIASGITGPRREIAPLPSLPHANMATWIPVTDIAFSETGKMLVGERALCIGNTANLTSTAHDARALQFVLSGNTWSAPFQFEIGSYFPGNSGKNSAGGVDYDCHDWVYATGDALSFGNLGQYIYGVEILPAGVNSVPNSYLVDIDGDTSTLDKAFVGDVEVIRCCAPCITMTCATNKTVSCGSAWDFDAPTNIVDTCCTNFTLSFSTITNGICPMVITRAWLITDTCGNTNSCAQTITVVNSTPPILTCATNRFVECGSPWSFDAPSAVDACSGANVSISVLSTTTNVVGCRPSITRTWVATDSCGNTNICAQTIAVVDTTPPVFTCATNRIVQCGSSWSFDAPSASDLCSGTNVSIVVVGTVTNASPISCQTTITRTWKATDLCDKTNYCAQTITVVNTTPPILTCATNRFVECGSSWTFDVPRAVDACSGANATISVLSTTTNVVGCRPSITRTWVATDSCGNTNICAQTIAVVDTTPPVFTCATNRIVQCGSSWSFDTPSASDLCSGTNVSIVVVSTVTNASPISCQTTITRTWKATDLCDKTNYCAQTITIVDTTPLVLTCASDKIVQCGSLWDFDIPSANSSCSGTNVTIVATSTVTNASPISCQTSITRTWQATNSCGNSTTCTQTVTVVDKTAPVITSVPKGGDLGCNPASLPTDASIRLLVTATDNCGVTATNVSHVDVTTGCSTTRTFTITASDACLNTSAPRTVVYTWTVDTTPPVFDCVQPQVNLVTNGSFEVGVPAFNTSNQLQPLTVGSTVVSGWNMAGPGLIWISGSHSTSLGTAFGPAADGNLYLYFNGSLSNASPRAKISASVTFPAGGAYRLEWDMWSESSISGSRDAGFTADLNGLPAYTYTDRFTPPSSVNATLPVVTAANWQHVSHDFTVAAGTYVLSFTDASIYGDPNLPNGGNTPSPLLDHVSITALGNCCGSNKTVECGSAVFFEIPTATDACCGTNVTVSALSTVTNGICPQIISRIWLATDCCGNSTTCTQTVTVIDKTAPVITSVPNGGNLGCNPATLPNDASIRLLVSATDNCGAPTINVSHVDGTTNCSVTRTFTITASDACLNKAAPRMVSYTWTGDVKPPNITACPTNKVIVAFDSNCQIKIPEFKPAATDNCTPQSQLVYSQDPPVGTIVNGPCRLVTVTVTDACKRSSTCQVLVCGQDKTPPKIVNCPHTITVTNCLVPNVLLGLQAIDNCTPANLLIFTQSPLPNTPIAAGGNQVTVTVQDLAGNISQCTIVLINSGPQSFLGSLFNTGVNSSKAVLPGGALDPHYTLGPVPVGSPTGVGLYNAPNSIVATSPWGLPPFTLSQWIAPAMNSYPFPAGSYTYTNQFTLPAGGNPLTAAISGRWAADNSARMYLNGLAAANQVSFIAPPFGFNQWTYFTAASGFLAFPSVNKLYCVVTNTPPGLWTGLRVEIQTAVINCSTCAPPSIISMTGNLLRPTYSSAIFTVNAGGTPPLTFQWYRNGVPLSNTGHVLGVNNSTLTIAPFLSSADVGIYTVAISNSCGQISMARKLALTTGWPGPWGWWNFAQAGNPMAATVGPNLILSGTNSFGISSGTTDDFDLPNIGGQAANVMHVRALPGDSLIQLPLVGPPEIKSVSSYTLIMDVYAHSDSTGLDSTLFETGDPEMAGLRVHVRTNSINQNQITLTGTVGGVQVNLASDVPMDEWIRVALVVDTPDNSILDAAFDSNSVVSLYVNGELAGSTTVPTAPGLALDWSSNPPTLFGSPTGISGETYVSGIQFHPNIAMTPEMIAFIGSAENGPIPADDIATPDDQDKLSVVRNDDGTVTVTWPGLDWTLQRADDVTGPWTNAASQTSPMNLKPGTGKAFYRLVKP